ncbi:hypothetical protein Anas_05141, partial [Armadillidium nasatum]
MWLNQYPFTLQKAPGGNMSYIPPWGAGGHYPPHMIAPQQPTTAHSPQSTLSSSSPLGSPQISPLRSPGKYPAPEQLPTPVMYSYQGRGRPRKHFTHATKIISA